MYDDMNCCASIVATAIQIHTKWWLMTRRMGMKLFIPHHSNPQMGWAMRGPNVIDRNQIKRLGGKSPLIDSQSIQV